MKWKGFGSYCLWNNFKYSARNFPVGLKKTTKFSGYLICGTKFQSGAFRFRINNSTKLITSFGVTGEKNRTKLHFYYIEEGVHLGEIGVGCRSLVK
jgi:hypothetical protein